MGQTATGQTQHQLRGARQWISFVRRTGAVAANLRFPGTGADGTAVSKVAEADSAAVARGGPAGRLRLGSVDLADGSEPHSDLRPSPARTGVLRRGPPGQPGSGPAGPCATDLRPRGNEENAGRIQNTRDSGWRASKSAHQLQELRPEAVFQKRTRVPDGRNVQKPERLWSQ